MYSVTPHGCVDVSFELFCTILVTFLRQFWLDMLSMMMMIMHDVTAHGRSLCYGLREALQVCIWDFVVHHWAFMENKHTITVHVWRETNEMFSCLHFLLVSLSSQFSVTLSGSDSTASSLQSIMAVSEALHGNLPSRICIMLRESSPLPQHQRHISILNRC